MTKSILAVAAVGAAAVLAACSSSVGGKGSGSPTTGAASSPLGMSLSLSAPLTPAALPDPCSLLTRAEAEALAGTKLNAADSAGPGGTKTLCQYTGLPTGPTAQVEILIGDGVQSALQIDQVNLKHPFRTVPGIGDQTLEEDDNIFIHKGSNWVQINLVLLNDPAQNRAALEKAAQQIVARLP